jgi:hypothetical protein
MDFIGGIVILVCSILAQIIMNQLPPVADTIS